ncbi:hypothetical protein AWZ03_010014 [Drosophila navojoa]|uniref:Uncharacterized protein n=1 Tax=Drosophila navojoa TaxID=7232 RepID=A0A484B413_DRONA|nr:hypothetical protein AWZ03_010014 [Drosophila navojoa]
MEEQQCQVEEEQQQEEEVESRAGEAKGRPCLIRQPLKQLAPPQQLQLPPTSVQCAGAGAGAGAGGETLKPALFVGIPFKAGKWRKVRDVLGEHR